MAVRWQEQFQGGSPEAERLAFQAMAREILAIQSTTRRRTKAGGIERAFHAKSILALDGALLRVDPCLLLLCLRFLPRNPRNELTQESEDEDASQRDNENPVHKFPVERSVAGCEWFRDWRDGPGNSAAEAGGDKAICWWWS